MTILKSRRDLIDIRATESFMGSDVERFLLKIVCFDSLQPASIQCDVGPMCVPTELLSTCFSHNFTHC